MKKIGVLYGKERSFPMAFIEAVNGKNVRGVRAESVLIDKVMQGQPSGYSVIIDRISQDVPFYRAFLKNAALSGTAVINNPFWWSADEKFFNNAWQPKSVYRFQKQLFFLQEICRKTHLINLFPTLLIRWTGKPFLNMLVFLPI